VIKTKYGDRRGIISALVDRDGSLCYLCGLGFSSTKPPTIEHVVPLSRGGSWDFNNLKLAHKKCNVEKGNRVFLEDGTLEPKTRRIGYRERKANKQQILAEFCDKCHNGRLLSQDESCYRCSRSPGGTHVPKYLWRQPKDCDHDATACWMCYIDLLPRKSTLVKLLSG
jgi:hypothetical protein